MIAAAGLSCTREENVRKAKLAREAERYKDVVEIMEKVAAEYGNLTVDERNLLFHAYKNVICASLAPFRIISSMEHEKCSGNESDVFTIRAYTNKLRSEISLFYERIFLLIDSKLNLPDSACESKVFYLKMRADFLFYLAYYSTGADREDAAEKALSAYMSAQDVANELSPINPTRLKLVLNFSVFYYSILRSRDRACEVARPAYDEGHEVFSKLHKFEEEAYIYSEALLQRMCCFLCLWTSDEKSFWANEERVRKLIDIKMMEVP